MPGSLLLKQPPHFLRDAKKAGKKVATLTAYDYPTARLLDDCGLDFLLVGDSLGMVVLGYPDTTSVTIEDMVHHTRAVARGATRTWVVSDMPAGTCLTTEIALSCARRLREAGADAVKLEGGRECLPMVDAILAEGIPVVGHLGMLPQRVKEEGGYRIKGKSESEAERILADALALDLAGVSAIVLELVHGPAVRQIVEQTASPMIGIGSGTDSDGQILVLHDLVGLFPWFRPKFAQARADIASEIQRAAREFAESARRH